MSENDQSSKDSFDLSKLLDNPSKLPNDPVKLKALAEKDPETAKLMLAKLSGSELIKSKKSDTTTYLENLAHPKWISDTKQIHQNMLKAGLAKKEEILEPVKPPRKTIKPTIIEVDKNLVVKYPFFVNVKKIIYANGDRIDPYDEVVILLHDYISSMFTILTDEKKLKKYLESEKKIGAKSPNSVKKKTGRYKKLLAKLFPHDYTKYFEFDKIKTKFIGKMKFEEASQIEEEKEIAGFNSSDDSNDEDLIIVESTIKDEEKIEFNKKRTEKMNEDDYINFTDCRSVQFSNDSREKFIEFLGLTEKGFEFIERNKILMDFLSYLATRCIGTIVENVLRNHNSGKLDVISDRISPEDAKEEIRKSLEHIKFNLRKIIKDSASIEEIAFKLFMKECMIESKTDLSIPNKNIKTEKEVESSSSSRANSPSKLEHEETEQSSKLDKIRKKWKALNSNMKKLWTARVFAEKQIKEQLKLGGKVNDLMMIDPVNSYAEYLINNFEKITDKKQINNQLFRYLFNCFQNNAPITNLLKQNKVIENEEPEKNGNSKKSEIKIEAVPLEKKEDEKDTKTIVEPTKKPNKKRRLGSMLDN